MNSSKNCSGEALRGRPVLRPGTVVKGKEVGGRGSESVVQVFDNNDAMCVWKYMYILHVCTLYIHGTYYFAGIYTCTFLAPPE